MAVDLRVYDVGRHDCGHACLAQCAEGDKVGGFERFAATFVVRQDVMAVAFDKAVAGEVFAARFHAAFVQAFLKGKGKLGHDVGVAVETAVADDGTLTPVQIQYRREG